MAEKTRKEAGQKTRRQNRKRLAVLSSARDPPRAKATVKAKGKTKTKLKTKARAEAEAHQTDNLIKPGGKANAGPNAGRKAVLATAEHNNTAGPSSNLAATTGAMKTLWLGQGQSDESTAQLPPPSTVRTTFLLVSDTHDIEPSKTSGVFRTPFPDAHVFIHAGDMTNIGPFESFKSTVDWIAAVPAEIKIIVAGNHDCQLDEEYWCHSEDFVGSEKSRRAESQLCREYLLSDEMRKRGVWYLEDEVKEFKLANGAVFTVLASPHTPRGAHPHNWGSFRYAPDTRHFWHDKFPQESLPERVHVAVIHGPAYGMQDEVKHIRKVGCPHLLRFLQDIKPLLSVCGHIHEAAGAKLVTWETVDEKGDKTVRVEEDMSAESRQVERLDGATYKDITGITKGVVGEGQTVFVNAAIVGANGSQAVRSPVLLELELPSLHHKPDAEHTAPSWDADPVS
ncbi:hypothetical protein DRE_01143 [Drechslerella stenobrocha 248]|uniref:Calcineurin-like phosphoesterase domain-containing protein n=1 Tax=Drechslerella stenobrocha 248 TaxID=1043628 RepID=W7HW71_9PEZI|nr:hypothetical protein DRE_01143 [Drechslerella stenobrocha 248]